MLDIEVNHAPLDPEWDLWLAAAPGGHHVQSSGWGQVKATAGWQTTRILLRRSGDLVGGCQLLTRHLPVLGQIGYVPRGPVLASRDSELVEAILAALRDHARQHRIALVKIQPPVNRDDLPALLEARGLTVSTLDTAPVASVVVDVGPDRNEDDIFRAMRATTRRRVRQARKEGVTVRSGGADDLPALQTIIEATARRQGFSPYPADYYRRMWDIFGASGHARLMIAEHKSVPLSGMLLIAFGNTVIYKIGGWAGDAESPHGASELMHWTAIAWAHDAGYRHYDFEGIPINVAKAVRSGNPANPQAHGVAFFKLGFGGDPVLYPGTYDLLSEGITGRALGYFLPRIARWQGIAQRLSGRA